MRRCQRCEAANPAHAQWCGQCYAPLEEARAAPATAASAEPAAPATGAPAARITPGAGSPGFRQRDGQVEWACVSCGSYHPLSLDTCTVCGSALLAGLGAREMEGGAGSRTDPRLSLAASVVLPGSGHVLAGHPATGLARALLFVVWLGGGLLLAAGDGAVLVTGPLLLGALALWAGSLVDVVNLSRSRPQLLGARGLLWLVVAVTLLSLLGLVSGVAGLV